MPRNLGVLLVWQALCIVWLSWIAWLGLLLVWLLLMLQLPREKRRTGINIKEFLREGGAP